MWDQKQYEQEDIKTKGDCCFNHIIGLPRKDGIGKLLFDYEKLLYDSLLILEFYNPSNITSKTRISGSRKQLTWVLVNLC
jgi:hypothetical protein